jgi:hypothetical protein
MRKIIFIIIIFHQLWAQSVNASLTIYKDGFGLIKQPVVWDVEVGKNTLKYDRLTNGLFADSPFLDLNNITILSQKLERDIFSSGSYFQNRLGEKVEVLLTNDKEVSGILIEYNNNRISIRTKSNIVSINMNNVEYISIKHNNDEINFRPILSWDVYANKPGNTTGNLVYLSSGFDWEANYRMILQNGSDTAVFIPEAFITNNSNLTFGSLNLNLVEGTLNRVQHQEVKSLMRSTAEFSYSDSEGPIPPTPAVSNIGDYYIYNIPYKMNIKGKESITVRLYDTRDISYKKTYLFQNYERSQKDEPLEVEIEIENTLENNLNIPLPQGMIELFQLTPKGQIEFLGEDYLKQIPKGSTAKLTAGRAFDVTGKRTILNYDRQRKSEEASIEIKITNTKDVDVNVRLIEKISGEWVIKDESSMYIKQDASTIYFPLTIPANGEVYVTYTYRKEWN